MAKKVKKSNEKTESTRGAVRNAWRAVFEANHKGPRAKRLTDEQILKIMQKEFPKRTSHAFCSPAGVHMTRMWFVKHENAKYVPYDKNGNEIEVKRGRKPGTPVAAKKTGKKTGKKGIPVRKAN